MVWEDMDVVWEVFIIPERLPLCPEVEFWKNETIFGISGSFVFFEASIIKSLKTPFKYDAIASPETEFDKIVCFVFPNKNKILPETN